MVLIKLGVLVLFVVLGLQGWNSDNLSDFAPFGLNGITSAAGLIFFSYIGLDAVSTAGEEVKNPRRTMPLAIIIALVTVTTIYIAVAVVAVAAQPYAKFEGQEAGLAAILEDVTGSSTPATILAAGAVISIFSVTLVTIYGQTRILFAMGRDGMVPPLFHKLNPRTLTPVPATIICAVVISLLAGLLPINFLAEMTSIGTLVAFLIVSIGVIVLRRREPDLPRGFKVPGYPVTPILSIAGCIWIIQDLRAVTIFVFFAWAGAALLWYYFYGRSHATLGRAEAATRGHAMTMVVGIAPDGRGRAALHLAGMLARSGGDDVLLCAVVPLPWPPSPARVDAEYRAHLDSDGERGARAGAHAAARGRHGQVAGPSRALRSRRPGGGGRTARRQPDRRRIVLGRCLRARGAGQRQRSPAAQLPRLGRPVAARAPLQARLAGGAGDGCVRRSRGRGRPRPRRRRRRGTRRRVAAHRLLRRPVTAAVHGRRRKRPRAGHHQSVGPGDRSGQPRDPGARRRPARGPARVETVVGYGENWDEALEDVEWRDGDVLVVGSSAVGPFARVFLGSRASKIVRHSPVPVVVVPRHAAAELAEQAVRTRPSLG